MAGQPKESAGPDREDLLRRLLQGRGDAVRELLAAPREFAGEVLLDCLCTPDPRAVLAYHSEGCVELLLATEPPLERWFDYTRALPAGDEEEETFFPLHVMAKAASRGSAPCLAFLLDYVVCGNQWRQALFEVLCNDLSLPEPTWDELLPKMRPSEVARFLGGDELAWRKRAERWPVVALAFRRQQHLEKRRGLRAAKPPPPPEPDDELGCVAAEQWARQSEQLPWSVDDYEQAPRSSTRRQVVKRALAQQPEAAREWLFDGLWDASSHYRGYSVERVDLDLPGARERLAQLVRLGGGVAKGARARLG